MSGLKTITVRCFAELNDFLPPGKKQKPFALTMKEPVTVGEVAVILGIPLSEVDLVTVNGKPAGRSYRPVENDYIAIYPAFETFDIGSLHTLQKQPLRVTRFILDAHLGKLARYLRMLGFDSLYRNDYSDREIIETARDEKRIILTRDKLLLRSPRVDHGYYIRAVEKHAQLVEVVKKFDLYSQFRSFSRCMTCNTALSPTPRETIRLGRIDPAIHNCYEEFYFCPSCDKFFWRGSHFDRMEQYIREILDRQSSNGHSSENGD
jgi:uncharacterized protein with PIN domain